MEDYTEVVFVIKQTSPLWIIVPALVMFLKDIVATNAILATEPGITLDAKYYYGLALIPGSLVVEDATAVLLTINVLFGAFVGLIVFIFLRLIRRRAVIGDAPCSH